MPDWIVQTPVSTVRPTTPKAPPAAASGGGSSIYGVRDDLDVVAGGGTTDGTGITVTLTARSTVAVFAQGQFDGTDSFTATFQVRVDASPTRQTWTTQAEADQIGAAASFWAALPATGVITLDAGSYLFYTRGTAGNNANAVNGSGVLTIIVGSNTEEDSFL
jgi:hypothetical protein